MRDLNFDINVAEIVDVVFLDENDVDVFANTL